MTVGLLGGLDLFSVLISGGTPSSSLLPDFDQTRITKRPCINAGPCAVWCRTLNRTKDTRIFKPLITQITFQYFLRDHFTETCKLSFLDWLLHLPLVFGTWLYKN